MVKVTNTAAVTVSVKVFFAYISQQGEVKTGKMFIELDSFPVTQQETEETYEAVKNLIQADYAGLMNVTVQNIELA